ncbi:MAG: hypothetical protein Q7K54_06630 [Candidatus Parcubacteria bacterium]|nr:hypothetical protein [Candidatus Parcubacteria bacterium]
MNRIRKLNPAIFIGIIFFIIPFFWFKPGEVDLGGDGTRLYFYDPLAFLRSVSLYSTEPDGTAIVDSTKHAYLIYVGLIAFIKYFINSPHFLINIFNGIKLSIGFLSIYFIVKELIGGDLHKEKNIFTTELVGIIAGFFYVVATGSEKLIFFWSTALHSHDQVFLNPLMFLLLMRYLLTQNKLYLYGVLFLSFIFSTNFAMISAPPLFAFYPIAIAFLLLYIILIRKIKILIKDVIIGVMLFLGIQSFHLIPAIMTLFDQGSPANTVVFKDTLAVGLNYFLTILGFGKASISLLVPTPEVTLRWTSFIAPLVVILGFLLQKKKNKEVFLTSIFFLITFFLVSANITQIGVQMYGKLFYIPGFSMFRNFYTQWAYVFIFFYALLFGQSLFVIFSRLKKIYIQLIAVSILIIFVVGFFSFLNGKFMNKIQWGSNDVKTAVVMDPRYDQTLEFIRKLPDDGKILILPLTSYYHQIIYGINNAAYVGPSSISFLTNKKSFAGYQNFDRYPYLISENILRLSREKNYKALAQLFSFFNIRYIYHNTDPKIYEEKFPLFPNDYMMTSFPKTQKEYGEFVKKFPVQMIYRNGPYEIFEFDKKIYRPEIYIADPIYTGDMTQVIDIQEVSHSSAFIDIDTCKKNRNISDFCKAGHKTPSAEITVKKNNPVQYVIHIRQSQSNYPFLLVFQNSYHKDWKLSFDHKSFLSEEKHVLVNKYANAWIITKDDRKGKTDYTLTLNLATQRYFQYGLTVTSLSLFVFSGLVVKAIVKRKS